MFYISIHSDLLTKGYVKIVNFNLMIFDEAHWSLKKKNQPSNHPYRQLMDLYKRQTSGLPENAKPRIIGLTASVLNPQVTMARINKTISEFEEIYESKVMSDVTDDYYKEAKTFVELSDNGMFNLKLLKEKNQIADGSLHDEAFQKTISLFDSMSKESQLAKTMKNALGKAYRLCYEEMGPWFAIEALKLYKHSMANLTTMEVGNIMTNVFTCLSENIEAHFRPAGMTDSQFAFAPSLRSAKVTNLLKLLTICRNSLNCIVFVNERTDANILYRWLMNISENIPEFGFLKPGFICGSPAKDFIRFDKNTGDFKTKFEEGELNVMIATAVLEEGIDVPICNCVIRYDFPVTFRAYVQSKGRARDRDSLYILQIDGKAEKMKWKERLIFYQHMEELLKDIAQRNRLDNQSLSSDDDSFELLSAPVEYQSFMTTEGAELREKDALSILHQYLQRLPSDFFTESRPNFIPISKQEESQGTKYCFLFILPINSSLTGIVKGEYRTNKAAAKLSCAFKVCKLLYEKGEIDGHLNIISMEFLLGKHFAELNLKIADKSKANYREELNMGKAVYQRITSNYGQMLRSAPSLDVSANYYLYMVDFPGGYAHFGKQQNSSLRMGILTNYPFPDKGIESLIYLNSIQLLFRVELNHVYKMAANESRLENIKYFHNHIVEHVLVRRKANKQQSSSEQTNSLLDLLPAKMTNFFLVPIDHKTNQNVIDFELIKELREWQNKLNTYHLQRKKIKLSVQTKEQLSASYSVDTIFACIHKSKLSLHTVREVSDTLPSEAFEYTRKVVEEEGQPPVKKTILATYADYFKDTYGFSLENVDVPMIRGSILDSQMRSKWKFGITYKVAKKDKSRPAEEKEASQGQQESMQTETSEVPVEKKHSHQLYPAELASKYPIPLSYFRMLNAFPCILYRLEEFFIAYEFLQDLAAKESPGVMVAITSDKRLPLSLLTADTFQNQSSNNLTHEEANEKETEVDLNKSDAAEYSLLQIDAIESGELKVVTNKTEQTLIAKLDTIGIRATKETVKENQRDGYLDELLAKLRVVIPQVKLSVYDRMTFRMIEATESLEYGDTSLFFFKGRIEEHIDIKFNTFEYVAYPNPWYIVKAFTLAKASDIFNLEQLETVGDAFLKMTTACYLYFSYLSYDEGKLSQLKTALVCNENLYKLALESDLQKYIIATTLQLGDNWLVPFYRPASDQPLLLPDDKWVKDQELKYKNIADAVEAFIGAFLVYGSAGSALAFFRSIGLKAFDPHDESFQREHSIDPVAYYQGEFEKIFTNIQLEDDEDQATIAGYKADIQKMVDESYRFCFLSKVEDAIEYTFKHKYFLVQAFTHPSFTTIEYSNQLNYISSYQRLEFIGDAILDYVITYFVYSKNPKMSPAQITLLRTALVNNTFYASIVVKYNLHKYLRYSNSSLGNSIASFVKKYKCQLWRQMDQLINASFGIEEGEDGLSIDEIDVPKALADIFESLVGAIFIDSGFDLDRVWIVIYRMIKVEVGKSGWMIWHFYRLIVEVFLLLQITFSVAYRRIPLPGWRSST